MATGSDMFYEHVCSPCEGDRLNNEAAKYCRQCDIPLCDPCVKQHGRFHKDHTVLDRSEMDKWIPAKYDFPKEHVLSIKSERKVNVRVSGNKAICYINDICIMHDGRIMVVDYDNGSLKMFEYEQSSVKEICFPKPYLPNGVCYISSQEYVSSVRDGNKRRIIRFHLNEHDKIRIVKMFLIDHGTANIRHNKERLYVSSRSGLYVYSMNGTLLNVMFRDIAPSGCGGFAFSDYGEKIHVAHHHVPSMTTISLDGERLTSWTDEFLTNMPGVAVLPNGTIFVCGCDSNSGRIRIAQLCSDGVTLMGTLLEMKYTDIAPGNLCFNQSTGELIVGGIGDIVLVLSLQ